jgi:uncharacterized alkaline shock family protein YloU
MASYINRKHKNGFNMRINSQIRVSAYVYVDIYIEYGTLMSWYTKSLSSRIVKQVRRMSAINELAIVYYIYPIITRLPICFINPNINT